MNFFIIDDKKIIIKELTIEEQTNFDEMEVQDFIEKNKFDKLYNEYIANKNVFDIEEIDEETKEAIITAIIKESDIKTYGDFYILKTFDKINNVNNDIFFLMFKHLKNLGYKYKEMKEMSQQTLIETFVYENLYEGNTDIICDVFEELNKKFNNEELHLLISEIKTKLKNTKNNNKNIPMENTGMDGLFKMK